MQLFLKYLFVMLHVLCAAAWFGLALPLARQARSASEAAASEGLLLARAAGRSVKLMGVFLLLVLVFALGAFFLGGGFAVYGAPYHTSLLLILVLLGVHFGLIHPGWAGLETALEAGGEADAARKRVAMGVGIGHLLWLLLLLMMFWNRLAAAL